jgi:protease-4
MSLEADALADRRRLRRKLSFWRILAFLALLAAIFAAFEFREGGALRGPHIARLDIEGIITDDEDRRERLRRIRDDASARALILAIDSPGGTTTGAEALFIAIREVAAKKPVVAVLGTLAASGGYIAAIGADHIVTRGNTLAGSIGVIFQWPNAEELMDSIGIEVHQIKSSPIKAEPDPFTETPPEAREMIAATVADSYEWFVRLVEERRPIPDGQARALADGRIVTGRQAVQLGLADEVGGEDEAKAWLARTHGVDPDLPVRERGEDEAFDGVPGFSLGAMLARAVGLSGLVERLVPQRLRLDGLVSVWHADRAAER